MTKRNGKQIYINSNLYTQLQAEAERIGTSPESLIKSKLAIASSTPSTQAEIFKEITTLKNKVKDLQLILLNYCILNEAELQDLGYLRAVIEKQAERKPNLLEYVEKRQKERSQLVHKMRSEIQKYLS